MIAVELSTITSTALGAAVGAENWEKLVTEKLDDNNTGLKATAA